MHNISWLPTKRCLTAFFLVAKTLYSTAVIVVVQKSTPEQATVFNCYTRQLQAYRCKWKDFEILTIALGIFSHGTPVE